MEFLIGQGIQALFLVGFILVREHLLRRQMWELENRLRDKIRDAKDDDL